MSRAIIVLVLVVLVAVCDSQSKCARRLKDDKHPPGGLSDEYPAGPHTHALISKVAEQIKRKYPREISRIIPLSARVGVVAGSQYLVKALIIHKDCKIEEKYVHLLIYVPLSVYNEGISLKSIRTDVDANTPLK